MNTVPDDRSGQMFQNLGRRKAYEEVADAMRRQILESGLQPLHRLPTERDLAEQFGVSRVVVREAIRSLERAGMVTVKKGPKGGIFVAQNYDQPINDSITNLLAGGDATIADVFEMRLLIEPYAASRAAILCSDDDRLALTDLLRRAEAQAGDADGMRESNIEFHRMILRMSRNPVLRIMGEATLVIMNDRVKHLSNEETSLRALDMHHKIAQAIRTSQPEKARKLMAADIQTIGDRLTLRSAEARRMS